MQTFTFSIFQPLIEAALLPVWEADDNFDTPLPEARPAHVEKEPGAIARPVFFKKLLPVLVAAACFVLTPAATGQTWFNGQLWQPKQLPQFQPAKSKSLLQVNRPVRFDLQTRKQSIVEESHGKGAAANPNPGNSGELPAGASSIESGSLIKSLGPLQPVADPGAYPARVNVKIFVKLGGACWECSGTLMDSRHVLTAGHCIYDGAWADTVWVVPAFTGVNPLDCEAPYGVAPFGAAIAVADMMSWTAWTQQADYEFDMGVVFLERPVGALTGWFGFGASEDHDFYSDNVWRNFSYPGESPYDGTTMYFRQAFMSTHYESISIIGPEPYFWDTLYVYHQDQGYKGQSGGGYYLLDWLDQRIIYGVVSHKVDWNLAFTGIAYIHESQFDQILDYRNDHVPPQLDLIPLWTQVGSSTVAAGGMVSNFSFIIHNYSEPTFSGDLEARVFLSTDKTITANDTQLGVITVSGMLLSERNSTTVNLQGSQPLIPADTPPGDYYLGVILNLNDYDTGNNATGNWDVDKITVLNLTVSPDHLTAVATGETLSFAIQSNAYWFISNDAPWLNVSQFNGTGDATVQVTCTPNPSAEPRDYTLLVVGPNGIIRQVTVWQAGVDLNVFPEDLEVPACGGELSFEIGSNFPWTVSAASDDWVGVLQAGETVFLQCEPNPSSQPRQVVVDVVAGQVMVQVVVTQPGAELAAPADLVVQTGGGESEAAIFSNTCWQVEYDAPWLTLNLASGEGDALLQITSDLNCGDERQASLILTAEGGGISQTILLTQEGAQLLVLSGFVQVGADGGSVTADVSANLNWTATSNTFWLTPNPATGASSAALTLSFLQNPLLNPRQAIVTVETECGSEQITVIQKGQAEFLSTDPDTLHFPHTADTQMVVVFSNVAWLVADKPAWVSVTPMSGFGFDTLMVICQPNPSWHPRSDTIELIAGGLHQNIFVYQKKKGIINIPGEPAPNPGNSVMITAPPAGDMAESAGEPASRDVLPKQPFYSPRMGKISLVLFPNPLEKFAKVVFDLPNEQMVRLDVLDITGKPVAVLAEGDFSAGEHAINWIPQGLPPGMYICRLTTDTISVIRILLQ